MEDIIDNDNDNTKSVVSHNNTNNYYFNYSFNYRFQVILFLFRLGERPFVAHSISINNTVYNVVGGVCVYITGVGLLMDTIVHRCQLAYALKKSDLFTAFLLVTWTHVTFR
jgi:hypothetical protein